ncbi:azurin [Methylotenera sp.]|uniref:azurin n=1 Tax=Methylotenera sp. TaxID=2051956 RepID=UPI0024879340|nr:azurin [Methylotenera sp.]MDI1363232.1 azurin [Methylotenera sp.]
MTTQRLFIASVILFFIAVFILSTTPAAQAATTSCEITVEANDAMAFNTKSIEVSKSCKEFTVNLKHVGKIAKNVMGHNLVIAKVSDQQAVLDDGIQSGAAGDYVKAKDARVIMATKVIGGGETSTAKFNVSKLNSTDSYTFFCSFPGHAFMMKGAVKLV